MARTDNIWVGLGFESGGEIIVGVAQQAGIMVSYGDMLRAKDKVRYLTFQQESTTIGLGLGGAGSVNLILGLNGASPLDFDGVSELSWKSIDFSLDMGMGGIGKLTGLAKYFYSAPELVELAAVARKFDGNLMALADALKKYDANAYLLKDAAEGVIKNTGNALDTIGGSPVMLALPLPGMGLGLRFSIKFKFETTDVQSWGTFSLH